MPVLPAVRKSTGCEELVRDPPMTLMMDVCAPSDGDALPFQLQPMPPPAKVSVPEYIFKIPVCGPAPRASTIQPMLFTLAPLISRMPSPLPWGGQTFGLFSPPMEMPLMFSVAFGP